MTDKSRYSSESNHYVNLLMTENINYVKCILKAEI